MWFSATTGIFARAEPVSGVPLPGAHQTGASGDAGVEGQVGSCPHTQGCHEQNMLVLLAQTYCWKS